MTKKNVKDCRDSYQCNLCKEETKYDQWDCKCQCINCGKCENEDCDVDDINQYVHVPIFSINYGG